MPTEVAQYPHVVDVRYGSFACEQLWPHHDSAHWGEQFAHVYLLLSVLEKLEGRWRNLEHDPHWLGTFFLGLHYCAELAIRNAILVD